MRNRLPEDKPTLFLDQYGNGIVAASLAELKDKACYLGGGVQEAGGSSVTAPIRINPRALKVATKAALGAGPLQRSWDELSEPEQRGCLQQAETLIRAYVAAKADDLETRRAAGHV